jgi:hypothetical protein
VQGTGRDERWLTEHGFERVHVELFRHFGPMHGLADVDGVAHYFQQTIEDVDLYQVWPAGEPANTWERESWAIWIRWGEQYALGAADADQHPGHGGVDARYDELEKLLTPHRVAPAVTRRLLAEWEFDDTDERYRLDGIDQWVRWEVPP